MLIGIGIALLIANGLFIKAVCMIVTRKSVPAPASAPEPEFTFMHSVDVVRPPMTPEEIAEFNNMRGWR